MNLIRIPIPNKYEYIDIDKIIFMKFDAYSGNLVITFENDYILTYQENTKQILDKILTLANCRDDIPKIPKMVQTEDDNSKVIPVKDYSVCDLVY